MKLYHRVSRFKVRRHISRQFERRIKWALTLKPGDLINDCTMYNVKIKEIEIMRRQTGRGWYISDVYFTADNGGVCSLRYCGVESPLSREEIESNFIKSFNLNGLRRWYGGDEEAYNKRVNKLLSFVDIIKNGGHITDEFGALLEEHK